MGKLFEDMMYVQEGAVDLSIKPDPGQSYLIKDILIFNPVTNYITVKIERTSVLYLRCGGLLGGHCNLIGGRSQHAHDMTIGATAVGDQTSFGAMIDVEGAEFVAKSIGGVTAGVTYKRVGDISDLAIRDYESILSYLDKKGLFAGLPVPTGAEFLIQGANQSGAVQLIIYDVYEEGDIVHTMENGIYADTYLFINYGSTGAVMNNAGSYVIDTPNNPGGFIDFPYGSKVPDKKEIDLIGILASDFAPKECDGTDGTGTKWLKINKERTVLFDENRNGLLLYGKDYGSALVGDYIAEGVSVIGNYSTVDLRKPFMLATPMTFTGGDEVIFSHTVVEKGAGKDISTEQQEIGLILRVRKVA